MSGIVRPLADVAGGEAGEPGAVGEQVVEVRRRHELRVRLAVHVDELREQELDAVGADVLARLVRRGGRRERRAAVARGQRVKRRHRAPPLRWHGSTRRRSGGGGPPHIPVARPGRQWGTAPTFSHLEVWHRPTLCPGASPSGGQGLDGAGSRAGKSASAPVLEGGAVELAEERGVRATPPVGPDDAGGLAAPAAPRRRADASRPAACRSRRESATRPQPWDTIDRVQLTGRDIPSQREEGAGRPDGRIRHRAGAGS